MAPESKTGDSKESIEVLRREQILSMEEIFNSRREVVMFRINIEERERDGPFMEDCGERDL